MNASLAVRKFFALAAVLLLLLLPARGLAEPVVEADVCVYGGTSAGVVAAIQVARSGRTVVLVEPGRHLGGMSVEGLGGTDIYNHAGFQNSPAVGGLALEFYRRVSRHYGREEAFARMLESGAKEKNLWRFEAHVAEEVFAAWLREHRVRVRLESPLREEGGVTKDGARLVALHCAGGETIRAGVFLDCTYEGDLLAAAGVSCVVGREGNAAYGETKNGIRTATTHGQFDRRVDPYVRSGDPTSGVIFGVQAEPLGEQGAPSPAIQGYSFRLCLTTNPENRRPIEQPAGYDPAHYELQRRYLAAGGTIALPSAGLPGGKTDPGTWHFLAGNLTGWNHDYPTATRAERQRLVQQSLAYIQGLYWFMAHDEAVPEATRAKWAAWGTCRDEFTDHNGWPRVFYVRNGRRMVSDFVLTEAHVRRADSLPVADPVGLTWWPPDLHHARRLVKDGRVWSEGAVFDPSPQADWQPCGIAYRALVPKRAECSNLLSPTCPSTSYVAYGAYRLEWTFMVAAQSAATAAVLALEKPCAVQDVPYAELQPRLLRDGQVLAPPVAKP